MYFNYLIIWKCCSTGNLWIGAIALDATCGSYKFNGSWLPLYWLSFCHIGNRSQQNNKQILLLLLLLLCHQPLPSPEGSAATMPLHLFLSSASSLPTPNSFILASTQSFHLLGCLPLFLFPITGQSIALLTTSLSPFLTTCPYHLIFDLSTTFTMFSCIPVLSPWPPCHPKHPSQHVHLYNL